jgi:hypothetical protein
MTQNIKTTYLGNPQIKRDNVRQSYTQKEMDEYIKCSKDPVYFCANYVKVIHLDRGLVPFKLYPYQKKMFETYLKNRFNITLACRQSGKSISVCGFLLWFALFNPEKTIAILANKGATAREMLGRITLMLESVPFFLQPGCKALNKGNIDFDNNSRIIASSTSSSAIRGFSVDILYLDEFAFVNNANTFYTSVYPVITSGKNTKVIITSTANGVGNLFHKLWEGAVTKTNKFEPTRVDWWDVPGRDKKWKEETVANTSERQFSQEYGNDFLGSSNTLVDANTLLGLKAEKPAEVVSNVQMYKLPENDHQYMITVDVSQGRGQDYHSFTIFDCSKDYFEQVAFFRDNLMSPMILPNLLEKFGKYYNEAMIVIESNDQGAVVCNGLYYDIEYENMYVDSFVKKTGLGVRMTKSVKRIGCSNLKDLLESGKLKVVDPTTISELTSFSAHGSSYAATPGNNDDAVMNLVMFAWFVSTEAFGNIAEIDLKRLLHSEKIDALDEDAFEGQIYIDDGLGNDEIMRGYDEMIRQKMEWTL